MARIIFTVFETISSKNKKAVTMQYIKNTMECPLHVNRSSVETLTYFFICMTALLFLSGILCVPSAFAVRLKDISSISGVRNNQLTGYGLVVGLGGTGDRRDDLTASSLSNMLEGMGIAAGSAQVEARNVASVMVTANLPASAKAGSAINVTISSIGSASSLQGGVLLQTPLMGIDGKVYAIAQGPLVVGGFSTQGAAASAQKIHTTVATIPNGATVEREVPFSFNNQRELVINMHVHDFSTTQQTVEHLNDSLGGEYASANDASTIRLQIPAEFQGNLVPLMASIENLNITPQNAAKVVVDEKTGTIVIGKDVKLARVAIAHGSLQVTIQESVDVSQPNAFSQGTTVASPVTDLMAKEESRNLHLVEGATLQELVDGLNAIGATPRDLISILRALKSSGSLYADLEVL